jgi:hypothetical protein
MQQPDSIRETRFAEIGQLIRSQASQIIDLWADQARDEMDSASTARRKELRNQLPEFLERLGAELSSFGMTQRDQRNAAARNHGEKRWTHGWKLDEVIRDYQLLRLTLLPHLDQQLDRKLELSEIMAIGLLLDDAVEMAVVTLCQLSRGSPIGIGEPVARHVRKCCRRHGSSHARRSLVASQRSIVSDAGPSAS